MIVLNSLVILIWPVRWPQQSVNLFNLFSMANLQAWLIDFLCSSVDACTGFRWDRQWLVVNQRGRAYTQRVEPKLALVEVNLPTEAFSEGWEPTKTSYMGKPTLHYLYLINL